MTIRQRAIVIGLLGPAIQAIGFAWQGAHMLLVHLHDPVDPRHLFFEGGFLIIGVGLLVTIVCVPVALEVARASEADVALETFDSAPEGEAVPAFLPQGQTMSASE